METCFTNVLSELFALHKYYTQRELNSSVLHDLPKEWLPKVSLTKSSKEFSTMSKEFLFWDFNDHEYDVTRLDRKEVERKMSTRALVRAQGELPASHSVCSRNMTGRKTYLEDFKKLDGLKVIFGRNDKPW